MIGLATVAGRQATTTSSTLEEATQQRRAFARSPLGLGQTPIVGQALLNGLKALPADVGGKSILDEHLARLRRIDRFSRVGATRLLLARVDRAIAPAISTGIDRMV